MASLRKLEEELVGEKHWTLKGEIKATERPKNALLDEINIELPFGNAREQETALDTTLGIESDTEDVVQERVSKLENHLETLIKRRICLKQFDNVDAIEIPTETSSEKLALNPFADEIDTARSKKGLTEEYVPDPTHANVLKNNDKELEDECLHLWDHLKARLTQLVDGFYIPPPMVVREAEA